MTYEDTPNVKVSSATIAEHLKSGLTAQEVHAGNVNGDALAAIVTDESIDLFARIPHGKATMLAQILLAADHNTYHLGQLVLVRKILTSQ